MCLDSLQRCEKLSHFLPTDQKLHHKFHNMDRSLYYELSSKDTHFLCMTYLALPWYINPLPWSHEFHSGELITDF